MYPGSLSGQPSRIEGHVRDEISGLPVRRAAVEIVCTSLKTRTDSLGVYRLEGVPAGLVQLRASADRYTGTVQPLAVEVGSTVFVELDLQPFAIMLDRLAGRAAPARPSENKVVRGSHLDGGTSSSKETGDRLTARVPGARVVFNGGEVGTATRILLRGRKSMNLSGDALYFLDGFPVAPPSSPTARNRAGDPSILDLIDPSTIERIEVISGPAAGATYGLGANNGVILIYTRR